MCWLFCFIYCLSKFSLYVFLKSGGTSRVTITFFVLFYILSELGILKLFEDSRRLDMFHC